MVQDPVVLAMLVEPGDLVGVNPREGSPLVRGGVAKVEALGAGQVVGEGDEQEAAAAAVNLEDAIDAGPGVRGLGEEDDGADVAGAEVERVDAEVNVR